MGRGKEAGPRSRVCPSKVVLGMVFVKHTFAIVCPQMRLLLVATSNEPLTQMQIRVLHRQHVCAQYFLVPQHAYVNKNFRSTVDMKEHSVG